MEEVQDSRMSQADVLPVSELSAGQVAFFIAYVWTLLLWALSEYLNWSRHPHSDVECKDGDAEKPCLQKAGADPLLAASQQGELEGHRPRAPYSLLEDMFNSNLVRCAMFDCKAVKQERATLRAMFEFGTLMIWYFISDRSDILPESGKSYSRDLLMCIFVVLTLVALATSLQTVKQPVVLVRQQTEEWKGWMQVLFLLYHYFDAKEIYNAIRLFIAAYVWMTGFGNFLYYYKTNDYSIGRFSQMMWRLNFLVFFACVVLQNSYMLYYICPMHTIFTVLVYGALGIGYQLNKSDMWICIKLVGCVAAVILLWDCRPVFYTIWWPFKWLVSYTDPRKPTEDVLYEWYFRSSLDRYVWIYGMLCGYLHPWFSSVIANIDNMPHWRRTTVRSTMLVACGIIGYVYYENVYSLPKLEYNKVHPYTSWIPITLWIVMRNLTQGLRLHHLRLYGWLGCITLETYICQFHIWMRTSIPDGQPKALLCLIPGYPLMNFVVVTAGYVFVSYRLFELTNTFKNVAVPHSNNQLLLRNVLLLFFMGALLALTGFGANHLLVKHIL